MLIIITKKKLNKMFRSCFSGTLKVMYCTITQNWELKLFEFKTIFLKMDNGVELVRQSHQNA